MLDSVAVGSFPTRYTFPLLEAEHGVLPDAATTGNIVRARDAVLQRRRRYFAEAAVGGGRTVSAGGKPDAYLSAL